jgi:hypothetical protein
VSDACSSLRFSERQSTIALETPAAHRQVFDRTRLLERSYFVIAAAQKRGSPDRDARRP